MSNLVKKYSVFYADPPWSYSSRVVHGGPGKRTSVGGAAAEYPTMTNEEILALGPGVQAITADNAALFLWVTMPNLEVGLETVKAWGFRYVTSAFTWVKIAKGGQPMTGPGHYTASNAEICLLGIKGRMTPARRMVQSVVLSPRREHSRKPDEVRERIEAMYPDAHRIELFCRYPSPGWDVVGNQLDGGQDIREVLGV